MTFAETASTEEAEGEVSDHHLKVARVSYALRDEIIKEKARRARVREFRSNLLPGDKFQPLTESHPYKVYYGGRDARKSWAFAEALVRRMDREPIRWLCTRQYQNSIKDSVHRVLSDMVYRLGLDHRWTINATSLSCHATGGEFIFKGLQRPNELKSIEGCHGVWVAEAQDVTEESWEVVEPTIRKDDSEIWVDFNTTSEDTPTWRRFVKNPPPGALVRKVGWEDNPYLSNRSRAKIAHMQATDPDAFLYVYGGFPRKFSEARIFGGKFVIEGFPDDLYLEALRRGGRLFYGLDFGFAIDPTALVRFFILDDVLYIEYEAFGVQIDFAGEMAPGLKPGDADRGELEQLLDGIPAVRDWPIKADCSRPETISFLVGKGFNVEAAEKWDGCVEDGIAHLRGFKKIVIHTRCREVAQEAALYSYKVDKISRSVLPIVVDAHNHGWDAIRYGLDGYIQRRGGNAALEKLGAGPNFDHLLSELS